MSSPRDGNRKVQPTRRRCARALSFLFLSLGHTHTHTNTHRCVRAQERKEEKEKERACARNTRGRAQATAGANRRSWNVDRPLLTLPLLTDSERANEPTKRSQERALVQATWGREEVRGGRTTDAACLGLLESHPLPPPYTHHTHTHSLFRSAASSSSFSFGSDK